MIVNTYQEVDHKVLQVNVYLQMRPSVPEMPNPHFCKNAALCAKRFTSYSNTAVARKHEDVE
jgi:hypothetical protein